MVSVKSRGKFMTTATNLLKLCDSYGYPISLTFKGDTHYKSAFGGIMTLLLYGLSIGYFVEMAKKVYHREDVVINQAVIR